MVSYLLDAHKTEGVLVKLNIRKLLAESVLGLYVLADDLVLLIEGEVCEIEAGIFVNCLLLGPNGNP